MINVLEWLNMDVRPTFWDCEESQKYNTIVVGTTDVVVEVT